MRIRKYNRAISMLMAVTMAAFGLMGCFPASAQETEMELVTEAGSEAVTEAESGAADNTEENKTESTNEETKTDDTKANTSADTESAEKTTASNTAEPEKETETPSYTVTLPYYEDIAYTYEDEKLLEQAEDKSLVLEYEAGDKVEIRIEHTEDVLLDELHVFFKEDKEISYEWETESGILTFDMPQKDIWIELTLASAEAETEEDYGWVEYVTTKGGAISATFLYCGESFDAGTYTYDQMEYGPWEAQYETTGTVTVVATADSGYTFKSIVLTDDSGTELASYDTSTVSFVPSTDCGITVTANFSANAEAETDKTSAAGSGTVLFAVGDGGQLEVTYGGGTQTLTNLELCGKTWEASYPSDEEITLTATAYDGYLLDSVEAVDGNGNTIGSYAAIDGEAGVEFVLTVDADATVYVSASFKDVNAETESAAETETEMGTEAEISGNTVTIQSSGLGGVNVYLDAEYTSLLDAESSRSTIIDLDAIGTDTLWVWALTEEDGEYAGYEASKSLGVTLLESEDGLGGYAKYEIDLSNAVGGETMTVNFTQYVDLNEGIATAADSTFNTSTKKIYSTDITWWGAATSVGGSMYRSKPIYGSSGYWGSGVWYMSPPTLKEVYNLFGVTKPDTAKFKYITGFTSSKIKLRCNGVTNNSDFSGLSGGYGSSTVYMRCFKISTSDDETVYYFVVWARAKSSTDAQTKEGYFAITVETGGGDGKMRFQKLIRSTHAYPDYDYYEYYSTGVVPDSIEAGNTTYTDSVTNAWNGTDILGIGSALMSTLDSDDEEEIDALDVDLRTSCTYAIYKLNSNGVSYIKDNYSGGSTARAQLDITDHTTYTSYLPYVLKLIQKGWAEGYTDTLDTTYFNFKKELTVLDGNSGWTDYYNFEVDDGTNPIYVVLEISQDDALTAGWGYYVNNPDGYGCIGDIIVPQIASGSTDAKIYYKRYFQSELSADALLGSGWEGGKYYAKFYNNLKVNYAPALKVIEDGVTPENLGITWADFSWQMSTSSDFSSNVREIAFSTGNVKSDQNITTIYGLMPYTVYYIRESPNCKAVTDGYVELNETVISFYVDGNNMPVYSDGSAISDVTSDAAVDAYHHTYLGCTSSGTSQFTNKPSYGYATMDKSSADTAITNGNSMYSLSGAVYGIYTDSACMVFTTDLSTDGNAKFTTQEDGSSNVVKLKTGSYYVKEITAPLGYELDSTVYPLTVAGSNTVDNPAYPKTAGGATPSDTPTVYSVDLILHKVSESKTDMSLAGAVFKFEFYAGATSASGTITKTWYFRSDSDGNVHFSKDSDYYLTSGSYVSDALYYKKDGNVCIPLGFLKITEIQAPTGFVLSDDAVNYAFTASGYTIMGPEDENVNGTTTTIPQEAVEKAGYIDNEPICGGLSVQKIDYMLGRSAYHGDTDLSGAVYTIVNAYSEAVYNINDQKIETTNLTDATATYAKIKEFVDASSSSGTSYVMQSITTDASGFTTTDFDGDGKDFSLPFGTYYVIETKAATGYEVNTTWVGKVTVTEDGAIYAAQTIKGSSSGKEVMTEQIYRGGISLTKDDLEMQAANVQGDASFEGAEFAIINASDSLVKNADGVEIPTAKGRISDTPTYEELRALADDGTYTIQTMTTGENGSLKTGDYDLPYGTYYIIETKASYGYWIDETFIGLAVIRENGVNLALGSTSSSGLGYFIDVADTKSGLASTVDQQVRRSDLSFLKVDIDGNYKSYIPFLVTAIAVDDNGNETELESHVIVSDANGQVDTSRTHSVNTNGFDQYVVNGVVTKEGEAYLKEASTWGIWFQGNGSLNTADMTVTDSYGALYGCYYRITELQCEGNASLSENLLESDLIYIYNDTGDLTELLSSKTADNAKMHTYHPLVDTEIVLTSKAADTESQTQTIPARESVEVSDTVNYTHVSADHTYRLETQFIDISNGNQVLTIIGTNDTEAKISSDGLLITKEFIPEQKSGTNNTYGEITISALLNTKAINGHTIVAIDYLYQYVNGNWILVAKHEDLTDTDQMLYAPDLHTSALDGQTGSRIGTKSENASIYDTVTYSNLAKGEMYVITMQVADADTADLIEGGKTVTSKRIYSRQDTPVSGSVTMPEFTLNSSGFEDDKTLVVIESLYRADADGNPIGEPVLVHDSLVDEDQTIRYPDVHTSASDSLTGDDVGTSSDTATVYDEVTVTNVIFDDNDANGSYTYTVKGTLVYQQDFTDADGTSHKAGESVETLDGTYDTVTITGDAAGNAVFTYADGSAAKGSITITGYGMNTAKSINGGADNSYITDSTAAIATITVELIYQVDSAKLEGKTVVVFEDLLHNSVKVASHADLTDDKQSVHYPKVETSAADYLTGDDVGAVKEAATIIDTVILSNLVPGKTYTVSGTLVNQADGSAITVNGKVVTQTAEITVGSDGTISAANGETTAVTAYDAEHNTVNGTVELIFTFDATQMEGETVVVFEDLIHNGVVVAAHNDLSDENQSVHFPEIHTNASDGYTDDHVGTVTGGSDAEAPAVIIDTVTYENLVPGREYTISGTLINKDTGYELVDGQNQSVMAERTFIAGETEDGITATVDEASHAVSGTVELTFTFDASLLAGTTVVAFENLEHNGITVTTHSDLHDEDQAVHFPAIGTSASDAIVGDEVGMTGETTITDAVTLTNLVPGMDYTISGVLMDKDTGAELLVDGKAITEEVKITVNANGTVTAENGETVADVSYDEDMNSVGCTVELNYTLDASILAGVTTVVFEDLIHNEIIVASHADITDLNQSVHFPEIHTTAADYDTSGHVGTVKEDAVIEDEVFYTNLVVGKEYTLTGTLYNRGTGQPLLDEAGNTITATATFTAAAKSVDENNTVTAYHEDNNSVDGRYLIIFTLDSSLLSGRTVVAFESLYHNGVEVISHADITDNEQSVYYPDIHTTAADSNTGDHVGSIFGALINMVRKAFGGDVADDTKQIITDTVALSNLVPGQTYVVSGKIYNATESLETGVDTPLVIDGEEVIQAVTITVSEDGKSITAADGLKTSVTAYNEELNSVDGTVDLVYTLDSSKIQGIEVVVFEKLYQDVTYTPETNPDEVPEEDKVNEHSDVTDEGQSVSEISIHTTAVDTATGDHVGSVPDGTTTTSIHDEVSLAGLVEGMEYTIDGVLVSLGDSDLDSGNIYYLKADGTLTDDRTKAYTESLTFTAEETSETHSLNFALLSDKVQGLSLTVFENIYHNGELISSHPAGDGDGWDEEALAEQTVYYPTGKTNATDINTGGHMSMADTDRTITDRVYFENLLVGNEYSITGQLVYKEAFTDADGTSHAAGEAVTDQVAVSFTAAADLAASTYADGSEAAVDSVTATTLADGQTAISGYVSISFIVDASKLAGATLVAFESFSHNNAEIFSHNDLNDLPQTIKIPEIHTNANVNGIDETAIYNEDGSYADITITDTVTYKNLWTADKLVAMADAAKYIKYSDGTIRTEDGVIYSVSEDAAYILKGTLMDKETGEAIVDSNGNTYTAYSDPFTPETSDGTYDITFTINAGNFLDENGETILAGKNLVVFEELYFTTSKEEATDDHEVAKHEDIDDEDQDIRIPNGRTHAVPDNGTNSLSVQNLSMDTMETLHLSESDGAHQVQSAETVTIVDYLTYENLHGNTVYTVTGTLMVITETDEDGNPSAWEAAVDDDGNVITVTEMLDTGILSDDYEDSVGGYLPLQFTFSALNLSGKTTVVFERISRDGVDVIIHADINDEAQTVEITPYDITVEISKKDITNDEELPGAQLFIRDADGNTVEEWTSTSEPHKILNIPTGSYTLTEVTAPDGYEVAETITFEVIDTIVVQQVTMYDSPKDGTVDLTGKNMTTSGGFISSAVKTGDVFRYLPAILLIVFGVSGVVLFAGKGKTGKKKNQRDRSKESDE